MPQKKISSFWAFFKSEILSLWKLPSRKEMDKSKYRIRGTIIELEPPVSTQKRIRRQSENTKQKEQDASRTNVSRSRPRSISAPQVIRIERRISRTGDVRTTSNYSKVIPHKVSIRRTSQVRAMRGLSSTVVEITIN